MRACLCEDCLENLVDIIIESNPYRDFNSREPHISSHTPCVDLSYTCSNGKTYTEYAEASSNFCCECGTRL